MPHTRPVGVRRSSLGPYVSQLGSVLALAIIVARGVRHFVGGFAVRFVEKHDAQRLETRVNLDLTGYSLD